MHQRSTLSLRFASLSFTWLPRSACLASLLAAASIGCTGSIGGLVPDTVGGGTGVGGARPFGSAGGSTGTIGSDGGVINPGLGGGSAGGDNGGGTDAGPVAPPLPSALPVESACVSNSPGPRLLRRLSAAEFAQAIADLFRDTAVPPKVPVTDVFNDPLVLGFSVDSNALLVQGLNADQLMTNAETVAAYEVANNLSQIAPCTAFTSACGRQVIESFGRRAFRTALPDTDPRVDAYNKLFLAEANFTDGVTTVVSAMLQSPYFLYRSEIGTIPATSGTGTVALTPYEVAGSLSYLMTGSMPDDQLLTAADNVAKAGSTMTVAAMVTQQAARLLTLPANQNAVMGFMRGWLGLDRVYTTVKDDSVYKLTPSQRDDMFNETRAFILDTFASTTNGTVSNLFTANYSFLNKNMADYYGINSAGLGTAFVKVPYTSTTRDGGILAHASILTGYARAGISSPTQRGHLVRTRLLCQNVPDPPPGLDVTLHPAINAVTTRQLYLEEHAPAPSPDGGSSGGCYSCHRLMDWIGVASEHYDSFGAFRTTENGVTIDATGTVYQADGANKTVPIDGLSGTNGLETFLATNDDLKHCMVRYWSYYAYGTSSWSQDGCTYDAIQSESATNSYSLQSVLMAIVHAPRFTTRAQDQ